MGHRATPLPDDWQIVYTNAGYYLQRLESQVLYLARDSTSTVDSLWRNIAGPYTHRWSAVQRCRRIVAGRKSRSGEAQREHLRQELRDTEGAESGW